MRFTTVHNPNLSLWQSAVSETADKIAVRSARRAMAMRQAASIHALAASKGVRLMAPDIPRDLETQKLAADDPQTLAYISQLFFAVAQARVHGDANAEVKAWSDLEDFIRKYSTFDILGWAQCGINYIWYYVISRREPPYADWSKRPSPDINWGVIDYQLPSNAKVLMLGDWGTHLTDNVAMLRSGLRAFKPDAIIHLGDIYYSGTPYECRQNVEDVMDNLVRQLGIARPPFFTIPGNHDYYSGGVGYFDMLGVINSRVPGCVQRASYFCLRSEDGAWQFLGMDTGIGDCNPFHAENAPGLQSREIDWHRDKLNKFGGTTILLSHHQLFSANAALTDGPTPWLNNNLHKIFQPYFDRVAAWFWGHEHNLVLFKEGQCGLRMGRLVGCSAYEEGKLENPYVDKFPDHVSYAGNMKEVDLSPYGPGSYYNHALALLEFSPQKITVSYFQYPSWGQDFDPLPEPKDLTFMLTETITPLRRPGV